MNAQDSKNDAVGHCNACNRSHSSATKVVFLEGLSYDSKKFWGGEMMVCFYFFFRDVFILFLRVL